LWTAHEPQFAGVLIAGKSSVASLYVNDRRHRIITVASDGSLRAWTLDICQWLGVRESQPRS
jgi:hypothetical protein